MVYVINLDEFKSIGTHWIVLYLNGNNMIYFYRFEVEHIRKQLKNSQKTKHHNKHLQNTSIPFDNVRTLLYYIN